LARFQESATKKKKRQAIRLTAARSGFKIS